MPRWIKTGLRSILLLASLAMGAPAAATDCFTRPLLIGRYHFPNPGQVVPSWQDIYLWEPGQPATRLSTGAFPTEARDHDGFSALPGRRVLFTRSAAGGTDTQLAWMGTEDPNGDQSGDPRVELGAGPLDPTTPVFRDGRVLATEIDPNGEAQIGLATLSITMSGSTPVTTISTFTVLTADLTHPDGYAFVGPDRALFDRDGDGLAFIDLPGGAVTPAPIALPLVREPTVPDTADRVIFSALQDGTLDLFEADILPGPSLSAPRPLITTPDASETAPALSADGLCLAWLSTPSVDIGGNPVTGPYTDLYIRDLAQGTEQRMTVSRDLAAVDWLRP